MLCYNIDLLQVDNDDKSCDFYNLMLDFGFRPLILQPTRVQTTTISTSATLIDNIFVNDFENTSIGGNITTSISDHFPQFCLISDFFTRTSTANNALRYSRNFKPFNKDEFEIDLITVNWTEIFLIKTRINELLFDKQC